MRTRVKICGITRLEDAISAVSHGADAIGFVFYPASPRNISPQQAAAIQKSLAPFVACVGLFVDATEEEVRSVLSYVHLDILQFHGDETVEYCESFGLPYMKAVRVKADTNLLQCELNYSTAKALLLDTYQQGVPGGTGVAFDWALIPQEIAHRVVLAGGLNPENVTDAIQKVRPYAVDVSGGVELTKGIKDASKIAAFMRGVSNASL